MDIKPWEYADFPAFNEPVPGATRVPTTGDKIGVTYHPDVPYATAGTTTLHLQILVPQTRNRPTPPPTRAWCTCRDPPG